MGDGVSGQEYFGLGEALGVKGSEGAWRVAFYFANRDKDSNPVNVEPHIEACMKVLVSLNQGVTRLPEAQGLWLSNGTVDPVAEGTTVVYSFIFDLKKFDEGLEELVEVFFSYGRQTRQDALFVEFSGEFGSRFVNRGYQVPHDVFS